MTDQAGWAKPDLRILPRGYAVCRLPPDRTVAVPISAAFFSVTRTADETSVVCAEEDAPAGAEIEPGWRLLKIEGPLDFSEIGILATLSRPLAAAGVSIFVVSTWDTDYLMVRKEQWPMARDALLADGYQLARD